MEIWFGNLNQKCLNESFNSTESIYEAIYAFVDLWNSLLAHPFTWKYNGKGLQQKAVNRFCKILDNSLENLDITFMTKQFLLMQNLIENYQTDIKPESWITLHGLICSNQERFNSIICKNPGTNKKEKAQLALTGLIVSLNAQLHKMAA